MTTKYADDTANILSGMEDCSKWWEKLSRKEQNSLTRLMANISEASYRRGAQQGDYIGAKRRNGELAKEMQAHLDCNQEYPIQDESAMAEWRYDALYKGVGVDGYVRSSMEIFLCEYELSLLDLGIYPNKNDLNET
jgi:hypothetical protein